MKFVLEVDLSAGAVADAPLEELGRILRYWAGNVKHYPLQPGSGETDLRLDLRAGRDLDDHGR